MKSTPLSVPGRSVAEPSTRPIYLKPALSNGELRCIGSTTYKEFKTAFDKDRALARRFQKIDVPEPTVEETFDILKGLIPRYEEHHDVSLHKCSSTAAELAAKYINERFFTG